MRSSYSLHTSNNIDAIVHLFPLPRGKKPITARVLQSLRRLPTFERVLVPGLKVACPAQAMLETSSLWHEHKKPTELCLKFAFSQIHLAMLSPHWSSTRCRALYFSRQGKQGCQQLGFLLSKCELSWNPEVTSQRSERKKSQSFPIPVRSKVSLF